jgi:curved DNA-binding protein
VQIKLGGQDHYQVLGVPRDASAREIRRAYRRLVRQHHPDVSRSPRDGEYFTMLTAAYDVLHDPDKRARYDHTADHPSPQEHPARTGRQEIARDQHTPGRGRDRRAVLELSPREAVQLATGALTVQGPGYTIQLPAGIRAGQQIRLIGAGDHGRWGGPPGDLLLTVEVTRLAAASASLIDSFFAPTSREGRFTWL